MIGVPRRPLKFVEAEPPADMTGEKLWYITRAWAVEADRIPLMLIEPDDCERLT
jgi:hypothetical protein